MRFAKEYANKDSRIRILKNSENKGLFHTRIEGERVANGKYIMHVDSDDFIELDACKTLYENIITYRGGGYNESGLMPDIVCFGSAFYPSEFGTLLQPNPPKEFTPDDNPWLSIFMMASWSIWNKAYHKNLIKITHDFIATQPTIPHISMAEDCLKTFLVGILAKRGIYIDKILYHYRCNNNSSLTNTQDLDKKKRGYQDFCFILDFVNQIPSTTKATKQAKEFFLKRLYIDSVFFKSKIYTPNPSRIKQVALSVYAHLSSIKYQTHPSSILKTIITTIKCILMLRK